MLKRRDFLKTSALAGAATLVSSLGIPAVHAAGSDMIKVALVGCGGRGCGAIRDILSADPGTKFWAAADAFEDRSKGIAYGLREALDPERIDVSDDRIFIGLDAYKSAIDSLDPGDVVILATPEVFRPLHYEYAVKKGVNIFAEKAVGADIPSLRRIRAANEMAKEKGLKVAVGLNNRHYNPTAEAIDAIQNGQLGDITGLWVYRSHAPNGSAPVGDYSPLQYQLRSNFHFDWTSGGWFVGALVHNIDICCWAKNDYPVSAQGLGGRISRKNKDQLMEIGMAEFTFADGKKMVVQTRNMPNVWHTFQANIQGTKASAQIGEGVGKPQLYQGFDPVSPTRKAIWEPKTAPNNSYETEQGCLVKAVREGKTYNEMDYGIQATFFAIMARMAVQTGQWLTTDQVWESQFEYVPNIDTMDINGDAPAMPDADGNYFIPVPGEFPFT